MKFCIDKSGVIKWSPAGWPEVPPVKASIYADMASMNRYDRELSRAKAESVPVREQDVVYHEICRVESVRNGTVLLDVAIDNIYDVPDSDINKEWL